MDILYCQKMYFPNSSAHALHTLMTSANFAAQGAPTWLFPAIAKEAGQESMAAAFRKLGYEKVPEKLGLRCVYSTHKGWYGLVFRAFLFSAMGQKPDKLCWASSVKEAVMALGMRALLLKKASVPVVFEIHHLISQLKSGREAERLFAMECKAFTEADMVVFNCQTLQDKAKGYLPEPRRSVVMPLGYNDRIIRPVRPLDADEPGAASGTITLTYVGSMQPGKGVENLLCALALLPDAYFLKIIGGWPEKRLPELKSKAEAMGLGERVRFTGLLDQNLVGEALEDCDIFVIPLQTDKDFFAPIKMFEALGFAMPVVATPMESLRLGLKEGENALFSAGTDPQSLAVGIRQLGENPALRQRMRKMNAEKARAQTSSARAAKLLALFHNEFGMQAMPRSEV